jgi:hypothetical protein
LRCVQFGTLDESFQNHHLADTRVTVKLALRAGPSGQLVELAIIIYWHGFIKILILMTKCLSSRCWGERYYTIHYHSKQGRLYCPLILFAWFRKKTTFHTVLYCFINNMAYVFLKYVFFKTCIKFLDILLLFIQTNRN